MCISGENLSVGMQHMNSLASTMWWGVLYTKDIDAKFDYDDGTAQLHQQGRPRVEIIKDKSFQEHHILPK